jgi:membrane-bound lytic murein transglycosylase F
LLLLFGCSEPASTELADPSAEPELAGAPVYTEDLPDLAKRGTIRIGRQTWAGFDSLPYEGLPLEVYYHLGEQFAEKHHLAVEWVQIDDFAELLEAPAAGLVDLVINNVTVTDERKHRLGFTLPLSRSEEWLIGRPVTGEGTSFEHITNIGLPAGTAYAGSVRRSDMLNALPIIDLPSNYLPDQVVDAIAAGQIDATVMDAGSARYLVEQQDEIEHLWTLPDPTMLAWVTRPGDTELLAALDTFLIEKHITRTRPRNDPQDLAGIRESGVLRMLTLSGPHTYFLWRGELFGFEYELLKRFADHLDVRLEVVLAPRREKLLPWLRSGRGDLVSAAMTVTPNRVAEGYHFTKPYLHVDEVIVGRSGVPLPRSLADLAGRTVHVNPSTSYFEHLRTLEGVHLVTHNQDTQSLLGALRRGEIDLTVADSHQLAIELAYHDGLEAGARLNHNGQIAWATIPEHETLTQALNDFIRREYRGLAYNLLRQKYFGNPRRVKRHERHRLVDHQLSPYDELIKDAARRYDFDWRLVVAQAYQESKFDPKQTSFAGARGLLQVLPRTARQVGIEPASLWEPQPGIEAGTRYLKWASERFESSLPHSERVWFTLAAYNAGAGHVHDARKLAARRNLNPDIWFGNVEQAMLLLSRREFAAEARHGFVRGSEPVKYVYDIRNRYRAYVDHLNNLNRR